MRYASLLLLAALPACSPSAPDALVPVPDTWTLTDRPVPATVAVTPGGEAVAAFARDGHVYVQRVGADGQAQDLVVVNPDSEDVAVNAQAPAQVALLPDGAVLVAWVKQIPVAGRRFPASELRVAHSSDSGRTFEPAITIGGDGVLTGHHFHDLVVAPDGTVYLSWLGERQEGDAVPRDEASHVKTVAFHPAPHGGHGGAAHAHSDSPSELRVARSSDGGRTFEPPVVVASGVCECCRTALTVAPDGTLFVAWRHQFEPDVRDAAVARSTDGGRTFTAPVRLPAPPWHIEGCPHTGPSLAIAGGALHALWFTGAEAAPGTYHAVSRDGGQTFTSTRLAPGARIVQARLAAGADGPLALWEDPQGQKLHLDRLGGSAVLSDTLGGHGPDLAMGPNAAWLIRQTDTQTLLERRAL